MELLGGKLDRRRVLTRGKDHGGTVGEAVEEEGSHVDEVGMDFWQFCEDIMVKMKANEL